MVNKEKEKENMSPITEFEDGDKCRLFLEDPRRMVAIGHVYKGNTYHGGNIPKDTMKVSVVTPILGDEKVLFPFRKVVYVKDAPEWFLPWPYTLIMLGADEEPQENNNKRKRNEEDESNKSKQSKIEVTRSSECIPEVNVGLLPRTCKLLLSASKLICFEIPCKCHMDALIVGKSYDFFITKRDILELLAMEELNISCIQVYMIAMRMYRLLGGSKSNPQSKFRWVTMNHRRQERAKVCGYYIMTYMKEIVHMDDMDKDFIKYFQDSRPYSQDDLEACREDLAGYLIDSVIEIPDSHCSSLS